MNGCTALTITPAFYSADRYGDAVSCMERMFADCTSLTDASNINVNKERAIRKNCFKEMFINCINLTKIFILPKADKGTNTDKALLEESAFEGMFKNCISLTNSPTLMLPPNKVAKNCYKEMFAGCTNFQQVLELPVTSLKNATSCYEGMFKGCESLTTAPELPATTLAINCYKNMFSGCINLSEIPALPTINNTWPGSYQEMFSDCIGLTNISSLSATAIPSAGYAGMFKRCNRLKNIGNIFNINDDITFTLSNDCCSSMFEGCDELFSISEFKFPTKIANNQFDGAFTSMFANCPDLTTLMSSLVYPDYRLNGKFKGGCSAYFRLFDGCSGLTETPKLIFPAYSDDREDYIALLETQEFKGMFENCISLSTIYSEGNLNNYFTNDIGNGFGNWLNNVAETGTFYTNSPVTGEINRGPNTIPSEWIISEYQEESTE